MASQCGPTADSLASNGRIDVYHHICPKMPDFDMITDRKHCPLPPCRPVSCAYICTHPQQLHVAVYVREDRSTLKFTHTRALQSLCPRQGRQHRDPCRSRTFSIITSIRYDRSSFLPLISLTLHMSFSTSQSVHVCACANFSSMVSSIRRRVSEHDQVRRVPRSSYFEKGSDKLCRWSYRYIFLIDIGKNTWFS